MLNSVSATAILKKYKMTLDVFVMHLSSQPDKTLANFVKGIINSLILISKGDSSEISNVLSAIKSQQFLNLINNYCHEKSPLRKNLNFFLHEEAFIRPILFYQSKTNLFSVKFPNQILRDNYIQSIQSAGRKDIKTYDHLNRDTFYIEFNKKNQQEVYFKNSTTRANFLRVLNLDPTLVTSSGRNCLFINNTNILDQSKNISINLPEDEKAHLDFKEKINKQGLASFTIISSHKNGFFKNLPKDTFGAIETLIKDNEKNTNQSFNP